MPPPYTTFGLIDTLSDPKGSAKAMIQETLDYFGLSSLGTFAWNSYLVGVPIEQIFLDIKQTPEYKQRFPAMAELAQQGRAITEAEYINYEKSATAIMRAAGLPEGFYDGPEDFANFLKSGVALPELQDRVELARTAIFQSDPTVLQALEDYYDILGAPENLVGDLTAYFLDETKALPLIQTRLAAAQVSSAATRSSYGEITRTEAERLATLGVDPEKASQGFGTLANMKELFTTLPGESGETTPTRQQGQAAVFESDAEAARAVGKQRRRRQSQFEGGGSFRATSRGYTGLG